MLDQYSQGGRDGAVVPRVALSRRLRTLRLLAPSVLFVGAASLAFWLVRSSSAERVGRGRVREVAAAEAARWRSVELQRADVPEAEISGRVWDELGMGIAGARVCASCAACELNEQPGLSCVSTDANGAYALGELGGAQALLIAAAAEGFLPAEANGGRPVVTNGEPRRGLDIQLRKGGAKLSGTVNDALGGPIAHARVQLVRFEEERRPIVETLSDADGRFAFWTQPGRVTLRAEAAGYAPGDAHPVAPSEDAVLTLAPESAIHGRVVIAGTQTAVAGVEVRAVPLVGATRAAPVTSDARGQFALAALDPGLYRLWAEADRWRGASERTLELGVAEVVKDVTVAVVPAVSVIGRLLDASSGEPCPRGTVILGPPTPASSALAKDALSEADLELDQGAVPSVRANVEPDGTVRLKGLSPGRYHAVLQCDGYVLQDGPELLELRDRDLEVVWKMARGIGLTIRVVDAAGNPVPHAGVTLLGEREGRRVKTVATALEADAHGIAQVSTMLYPGTYTIKPYGLGGDPLKLALTAGAGRVDVTLRLAGSGAIVVDARDARERPIDGLQVRATGQGESTSELLEAQGVAAIALGAGRYRVGPLPAGRYTVEVVDGANPPVSALGPRGSTLEVTDGATLEARVRLVRGASITGSVVDEKGEPQANVWVSVSQQTDAPHQDLRRFLHPPARVLTDTEGGFVLEQLERGARFTLEASQPFGGTAHVRDVAPGTPVRVILPTPAAIAGVVVDAQGRPVPRFEVQATHVETNSTRAGYAAGAEGRFRIDGLPAGRVQVHAHSLSHSSLQELELRAGQKFEGLRLVLTPTALAAP